MRVSSSDIQLIDDDHPFSYSRLSAMKWDDIESHAEYSNYSAYVEADADSDFITLEKNEERIEKKNLLAASKSKGVKLHISISDLNDQDQNLARAWQIVYTTVMQHEIKKVKIIKGDARIFMRAEGDKAGKEITWYFFKDRIEKEQVNAFLNELTQKFVSQGIIPGPIAKHDQGVITGSNYFSYRNDKKAVTSHTPFEGIEIEVEDQPDRLIPPDIDRSGIANRESYADIPKRISMEDSASNEPKEYNGNDGPNDPSCCSSNCRK